MKKLVLPFIFFLTCFVFQASTLSATNNPCDVFDIKLKTNGILCGETKGAIWLDILEGQTGIYEIEWYSPYSRVDGKATAFTAGYDIPNLPKGTYTVKVTDYRTRCSVSKKIEIATGAMPEGLTVKGNPANCKGLGSIAINIPAVHKPPFHLSVKGPTSEKYVSHNNITSLYNLPAGDYELSLEQDDCVATTTVTIPTAPGLPTFTLEDEKVACDVSSGNVIMSIQDGTPGYIVTIDGPTSGTVGVSKTDFRIANLKSGAYKITLEDGKGCLAFGYIDIERTGLSVELGTVEATCSQNGKISVDITKGIAPYAITYRGGGIEGNKVISESSTSLSVPVGTYIVEVKDGNGCRSFATTSIQQAENDLYCSITPSATTCNEANGAINVFISGGKKPYTLSYTGPASGSKVVNGTTSFENLPAGVYTTFLKDANGCAVSESSEVVVGATSIAKAEFAYVVNGPSLAFYNYSPAFGDFHWTFGDGTSSTESAPNHDYKAAGSYEVCLTQTGNCNVDVSCQTIQIGTFKVVSGLTSPLSATLTDKGSSEQTGTLRLQQNYPNPFVNQTNILFELPEALLATIMIHDNTGKVVQTHSANYDKGTNLFTFSRNNLVSGVYYYTLKAGTFSATKKLIIR